MLSVLLVLGAAGNSMAKNSSSQGGLGPEGISQRRNVPSSWCERADLQSWKAMLEEAGNINYSCLSRNEQWESLGGRAGRLSL